MTAIIAFIPIIIYLFPIIFVIWFLVKFLKIQQEKNEILRTIANKLKS